MTCLVSQNWCFSFTSQGRVSSFSLGGFCPPARLSLRWSCALAGCRVVRAGPFAGHTYQNRGRTHFRSHARHVRTSVGMLLRQMPEQRSKYLRQQFRTRTRANAQVRTIVRLEGTKKVRFCKWCRICASCRRRQQSRHTSIKVNDSTFFATPTRFHIRLKLLFCFSSSCQSNPPRNQKLSL